MASEFVIKHGFISNGDSIVNGTISGETLNLTLTPSNDNSQTQVLVRNNSSGIVEYRDASTFSGSSGSNTFVTGFTYNDNNTFTIFDNDGGSFPATINQVSGLTVNGTLSATTLDGNTILSGGTNLLTIIDDRDTFVTGTTFGGNQAILTRNDGTEVFKLSGSSSVQLTNPSSNKIDIDVTIPPGSNTFVTGFTYDNANTFTISDNDGGSFPATFNQVSGLTVNGILSATTLDGNTILSGGTNLLTIIDDRDNYVTGTTFSSNQSVTTTRDGVDVLKISGGTNVTLSNPSSNQIKFDVNIPAGMNTFVTGFTYNDNNTFTIFDNSGSTFSATFDQVSGLTVNGILSATTISGGTLYGDGSNLTGIPHTTDTFVTGGTYNPSTINLDFSGNPGFSPFTVDVSSLKDDTNTFVTGFTYDNANTFTINDNSGTTFNATINTVTGLTVNGILSATTISGGTLYGDGANLTGIATAPTLISLTADYTGVTTDYTFNCTTNTFTVTLPTAIGVKGKIYVIKNSGTGRITVDTTSSQTIDGSTSILIKTQYLSRTVQSNGSDWIVI